MSSAWEILRQCEAAVNAEVRTQRQGRDKEFHFQDWVGDRIKSANYSYPAREKRNTFPDFPIDGLDEAYEVKGITEGSRERDFDSNSTLPANEHNGHRVYYIFGRYEGSEKGGETPRVLDLVIVDGAYLNSGATLTAKNRSLRALGSYGDILLRDRKMYAPYTPYKNLSGLRGHCTLIVQSDEQPPNSDFVEVGRITRRESDQILVGYRADLIADTLTGEYEPNPHAGRAYEFVAYRTSAASTEPVEWIDA